MGINRRLESLFSVFVDVIAVTNLVIDFVYFQIAAVEVLNDENWPIDVVTGLRRHSGEWSKSIEEIWKIEFCFQEKNFERRIKIPLRTQLRRSWGNNCDACFWVCLCHWSADRWQLNKLQRSLWWLFKWGELPDVDFNWNCKLFSANEGEFQWQWHNSDCLVNKWTGNINWKEENELLIILPGVVTGRFCFSLFSNFHSKYEFLWQILFHELLNTCYGIIFNNKNPNYTLNNPTMSINSLHGKSQFPPPFITINFPLFH